MHYINRSNMNPSLWKKYLPIIRILIKRTHQSEQVFDLNATDFLPAGPAKKGTQRFSLQLRHGMVVQHTGTQVLAGDLARIMAEDEVLKAFLAEGHFQFNLNTKHQLSIRRLSDAGLAA